MRERERKDEKKTEEKIDPLPSEGNEERSGLGKKELIHLDP